MSTLNYLPTSTELAEPAEPSAALHTQFSVGEWLILPETNQLQHSHSGLARQLEPRLIHLLCYLAANSDRVLSRDKLVEELWPHLIVNENPLTRAIAELRKQLSNSSAITQEYIETIPKKGYRLIPAVEWTRNYSFNHLDRFAGFHFGLSRQQRAGIATLCLTVALGSWLTQDNSGQSTNNQIEPQFIADEVIADELIESGVEIFGGEITLSTIENPELALASIESPVISNSASKFAYIRYDHTGSTIFIGDLEEEMTAPVAIYNSPAKLYNLAWSPVGERLLFAKKSMLTTAAIFSQDQQPAELIILNLETLEAHRLVEEVQPSHVELTAELNLT